MRTDAPSRVRGYSEPPLSPQQPSVSAELATRCTIAEPVQEENPLTQSPPPEWIARITLACVEVAYGRRSIQQLRSITSRTAMRRLELLQQTRSTTGSQHVPISCGPVRISAPAIGVLEVSCTVAFGSKAFPLALRLEYLESRWTICAIEMGPH